MDIVFLIKIILFIVLVHILFLIYKIFSQYSKSEENKKIEDLKRRIEELDIDDVNVDPKTGKAKIIVPDKVNPEDSTQISTQKKDCKVYEVTPKEKENKIVVEENQNNEIFENSEVEDFEFSNVKDKKVEEPIKEKEGFISKILNKNEEE